MHERITHQAVPSHKTFIRVDCLRKGQAQSISAIEYKNEVLNINSD
jgi:hypothetical protein